MEMPPKETPWGSWQKIQELIPGIWLVKTASHGGLWLAPEQLALMPVVLREGPPDAPSEKPFNLNDVRDGWFDEGIESGRVVLTFAVGASAPAFPGGAESYRKMVEVFTREYPATVAKLRAAGFFDRDKPKSGNPVIPMRGAD